MKYLQLFAKKREWISLYEHPNSGMVNVQFLTWSMDLTLYFPSDSLSNCEWFAWRLLEWPWNLSWWIPPKHTESHQIFVSTQNKLPSSLSLSLSKFPNFVGRDGETNIFDRTYGNRRNTTSTLSSFSKRKPQRTAKANLPATSKQTWPCTPYSYGFGEVFGPLGHGISHLKKQIWFHREEVKPSVLEICNKKQTKT